MLPEPGRTRLAGAAAALGASPIVERPPGLGPPGAADPFAAGLGTEVQWVFDRSGSHGALPPGAQYLVVSLSAADAYLPLGAEALVARFTAELGRLLPAAAGARSSTAS